MPIHTRGDVRVRICISMEQIWRGDSALMPGMALVAVAFPGRVRIPIVHWGQRDGRDRG